MAQAVVAGVKEAGGEAVLKRVPELLNEEVLTKMHATESNKKQQSVPVADVKELAEYDAIIFGFPTRFGNMPFQMKSFLDQTGGLWYSCGLVGKVASFFTSSTQHCGQESTLLTSMTVALHHGMVIVGLPGTYKGLHETDGVKGCSFYGATAVIGDGKKPVTAQEKDACKFQGAHVAKISLKLKCK